MRSVITSDARTVLSRLGLAFRRVVGMPNYEAYVGHLRDKHPECAIPTEREYFDLYLKGKYGAGTSRCC